MNKLEMDNDDDVVSGEVEEFIPLTEREEEQRAFDDALFEIVWDMVREMKEYVRYERKPLLEHSDMDIWIEYLKCCL